MIMNDHHYHITMTVTKLDDNDDNEYYYFIVVLFTGPTVTIYICIVTDTVIG